MNSLSLKCTVFYRLVCLWTNHDHIPQRVHNAFTHLRLEPMLRKPKTDYEEFAPAFVRYYMPRWTVLIKSDSFTADFDRFKNPKA